MSKLTLTTFLAIPIAGAAAPQVPAKAQSAAPLPKLSFQVASIKVGQSNTRAPLRWYPNGRFTMGLPVLSLVSLGYQLPVARIARLPAWARTVYFDINAVASGPVTLEQQRAYYRGLLGDRFGFVAHDEERDLPVYALVLARADGRLGPGLRQSAIDCAPIIADNRRRAEAGERPEPPKPGVRPTCGSVGGANNLVAGAVEIGALVGVLGAGLDRPVVDRTGLPGRFDIDFRSAPLRPSSAATPSSDLPSVFTAVEEQLGLKLEPTTGPVRELVVDRIEMPTEN